MVSVAAAEVGPQSLEEHRKRSWEFFRSIGSPALHVAPMVDQVMSRCIQAELSAQLRPMLLRFSCQCRRFRRSASCCCLSLQSELAFRMLCRQNGATAAYTPMLHARIFSEDAKYRAEHFTTCAGDRCLPVPHRLTWLDIRAIECTGVLSHQVGNLTNSAPGIRYTYHAACFAACRPLFVQFCGNDADTVLAAARHVEDQVDAVDLNFGCPQRIARRGRYGAYLMDDLELVRRVLAVAMPGAS